MLPVHKAGGAATPPSGEVARVSPPKEAPKTPHPVEKSDSEPGMKHQEQQSIPVEPATEGENKPQVAFGSGNPEVVAQPTVVAGSGMGGLEASLSRAANDPDIQSPEKNARSASTPESDHLQTMGNCLPQAGSLQQNETSRRGESEQEMPQ